eukprot:5444461-Lingulodinium_polyedra.AAC.1
MPERRNSPLPGSVAQVVKSMGMLYKRGTIAGMSNSRFFWAISWNPAAATAAGPPDSAAGSGWST